MDKLKIQVEVAYALPEQQKIIPLAVVEGTTAYEAVQMSGVTHFFPQIELESAKMGIFGKTIPDPKSHVLREGDRVEIYRPLKIDPKQARLNRAKKG
ncbi:RnfH family protein [Hahella sp. KA22]|uniref:RnfH family protein n=1 Tax=Hahella sp. KA22 TaxID=1628392 RepID=UPI000FDD32A0|nr:RnfH family protein [Hahella sp. KA22]AZZ94218.1 RnfH family protein [Hahella sp. KA22]QAY57592.1 RnfH family protein [Hahella sp. KA22]